MTSPTIPIVDFAPFITGSRQDQIKTAAEIDEAFRDVGFVYLQNHGVPTEKVEQCFQWVSFYFTDLRTHIYFSYFSYRISSILCFAEQEILRSSRIR